MIYRNIKTGVIVDVKSKVEGDWELVSVASADEEQPVKKASKKPKKKEE